MAIAQTTFLTTEDTEITEKKEENNSNVISPVAKINTISSFLLDYLCVLCG
jgi:hypothetical protein